MWASTLGAGMVHSRVLEGVGYDPSVYTGFAFGLGPERIAMLKYGIDDIRHFRANDVRFLRQFQGLHPLSNSPPSRGRGITLSSPKVRCPEVMQALHCGLS